MMAMKSWNKGVVWASFEGLDVDVPEGFPADADRWAPLSDPELDLVRLWCSTAAFEHGLDDDERALAERLGMTVDDSGHDARIDS